MSEYLGAPGLYLFIALLTVPIITVLVRGTRKSHDAPFPPGPPADPIIGHLLRMPFDNVCKTFAEWKKIYGDVIYLRILGRPIIVLNSFEAANELLEKRGSTNSDRPPFPFIEMVGWGPTVVCLPYGERWRRQRKFMQPYFSPTAIPTYRHLFEKGVATLLQNLAEKPENLKENVHRMISTTIALVTYGHETADEHDYYSQQLDRFAALLAEYGTAGGTPVDLFPWLRHIPSWFPGAFFKRHAQKSRVVTDEIVNYPFDEVTEKRVLGTAKASFVSDLLDEYEGLPAEDPTYLEDLKYAAMSIHVAGVETTEAALMNFFIMIMNNPEVAKRAQSEIDAIIGPDRLPTFDDREDLPYIDCILKETLRINPPVSLGLPHRAMVRDSIRGMTIPAGSMFITNVWGLSRDDQFFSDPEEFNPDRYSLKQDEVSNSKESSGEKTGSLARDPSEFVFGFGRRVCPGRHFAEASMWLTISNVLAAYDILPPVDPVTGKVVPQKVEFSLATTSHPKPYRCRFVPRKNRHKQYSHLA